MDGIKDIWAGSDPDDVSGYLLDYLNGQMSDDEGKPLDNEALGNKFDLRKANGATVELMINLRNAVKAKGE